MSTASSSAILTQAASGSPAGIQAWTGELVGQLIACGLVQTNDTGQTAITGSGGTATTACGQPTLTGPSNATGYVCFTFTDTPAGGNMSTATTQTAGTGETGAFTGTLIGSKSGASANVTAAQSGVGLGAITFVSMVSGAFFVGEKLTVNSQSAGGASSGWIGIVTALSSGSPVIFRLDFGGGTAVTDAQMWITVGAGTNGSGTIAGTAATSKMTQVACFTGAAAASLSTAYTSRFVWNATYGYCGVAFKLGATSANVTIGGFILLRSNDGNGVATGTSIQLISNSDTSSGNNVSSTAACMQCMTWSAGAGAAVYPATIGNGVYWPAATPSGSTNAMPFAATSTLNAGQAFILPGYIMNPNFSLSAYLGLVEITECPIGNTISAAIIGSTALTFLDVGTPVGVAGFGGSNNTVNGFLMLWQ